MCVCVYVCTCFRMTLMKKKCFCFLKENGKQQMHTKNIENGMKHTENQKRFKQRERERVRVSEGK